MQSNSYNALGQRVKKAGAQTLYFMYDEAGHLLGEYQSNGAVVREYVWLGDRLVGLISAQKPGVVLQVHTDHLGSPRAVSDGVSVFWRWEGDAFGNTAANEDVDADSNTLTQPLRFPGQYKDTESGLNYNYFRDYNPATGRYVESDPIGLGLFDKEVLHEHGFSLNHLYGYASQNPIANMDFYGLSPEGTCGPPKNPPCKKIAEKMKSLGKIAILIWCFFEEKRPPQPPPPPPPRRTLPGDPPKKD